MAVSVTVVARPWLLLSLPLLGLIELASHFVTAECAPSLDDWRRLRPAVAAEDEPGTLVVVAPSWAEPLARSVLGEELMSMRDLARPTERTFPAVLEISLMGARAPELAGWELVRTSGLAPFTIRRWHNPNVARTLFDFVDGLRPPDVSVAQRLQGVTEPCAWTESAQRSAGGLGGTPALPRQRFRCASHEPSFAGTTIIDDESYRPRRCVWAPPPPNGVLELTYRDVPLGAKLRGHMGTPWLLARDGLGTEVGLEVSIDGRRIATWAYDGREGWRAFEIETRAWASGAHEVVWRVSSERFDFRYFCFEARAE